MGIERIEPAIPRKDIDRRIYVLRREKIRNTAKRFKLQTIISRYNTFQQYWQRICREIENGTYKRHVIKAERIAPGQILTIAARKRLGRAALEAMEPDASPAESSPPPSLPPSAPPSAPPSGPRLPSLRAPAPTPQRLAPPPKPVPPPKPGARPAPPAAAAAQAPAAPAVQVASAAAIPAPPARPAAPSVITAAAARPAPPAPSAKAAAAPPPQPPAGSPPPARPAFESLDLDMDFLGDWDPNTAKNAGKRPGQSATRPFGKPLSQPMNTPPTPSTAAAPQRPAPAKPAASPPRAPSAPPPKPVTIPPRPAATTKPLSAHPAPPPRRPRSTSGCENSMLGWSRPSGRRKTLPRSPWKAWPSRCEPPRPSCASSTRIGRSTSTS